MKKYAIPNYVGLKKLFRIMQLSTIFCVLTIFELAASNIVYSQPVNSFDMNLKNVEVQTVLKEISQKSTFDFFYNSTLLDNLPKVNVKVRNAEVGEILDKVIPLHLFYELVDETIIIKKKPETELKKSSAFIKVDQERTITGTVKDENNEGLPGVNVVVTGTTIGTITAVDGKYTLSIPEQGTSIQFSAIGYSSQEIQIGSRSIIDVTLTVNVEELDEIVVTALGIRSQKKSLGYATQNISAESITRGKETNIANSLAGKIPGVQITPAASGMGGSSRILIRGNSSLSGNNQPLYVVDGMPIDNSGFGTSAVPSATAEGNATDISAQRTDFGTGISDINPEDIESMSILKGPNGAALYGNRGANGVIIITTKKGSKRKGIGVNYRASVMTSTVNESTMPQFQNEYGKGNGGALDNTADVNWGPKFDGSAVDYKMNEDGEVLSGSYVAQPNNVLDFFDTGVETTHNLGIEGGNETASIRFSYTNFDGKGIMPNAKLSKNTFNLRATAQLTDKFSFDSKVTYFNQSASNRSQMGWGNESAITPLYRMDRNSEIQHFKNNYQRANGGSMHPYGHDFNWNPYYLQNRITDEDEKSRVLAFSKLTYTLNENLSAFVRIGTDALSQKVQRIVPFNGEADPAGGSRKDSRYGLTETNADFLILFNKELSTDFNLNLNVGGNYRFNRSDASLRSGETFNIPSSTLYSNLATLNAGQETSQRAAIYSLYFAGSLDFKKMIYLNFTGRNDWDSRMWTPTGESTDWSFFYPSVSLSLLGNEMFGINSSVLSFSKLRFAWAEVGSGGLKQDQIFYSLSPVTGYNGNISVSQSNVFDDAALRPESTQSIELGLELKFFNNRLYTDFTYYSASTFDQIINAPVDASTGFQYKRTNVGEISNKGIELLIGGTPIQGADFYWDVSVNIYKNTSVLESFIEGSDSYLFTNRDNFSVKTKVGGNYGDIWGNDFVYENGQMVLDDLGLPVSTDEEQLLGNYLPDFQGGFSNSFGYKDLQLNVLIDFRVGGEAIDWTTKELGRYGSIERTLEGREGQVWPGVTTTGTANTVSTTSEAWWAKLEGIPGAYIMDLTNVRLRELSLDYRLPNSWFDNIFFNSASVSIIGRNLGFLSKKAIGADPESTLAISSVGSGLFYYNMPTTRRLGFSVNVSF